MDDVDVVVVGAGYAGLCAARALWARGASVLVLEARDRVGGRVQTERTADGWAVDLGGMWCGPGHDRLAALAREHGLATHPSPTEGDGIVVEGPRRRRFGSNGSPVGPVATAALALSVARLDRMAARIDVARPWASAGAERHDATTVATWLRRNVPVPRARRLLDLVVTDGMSVDPAGVSMLALLTAIRAAGGVRAIVGVEGGAQQDLFTEGADGPARAVAAELGDAVRLGAAVTSVRQDHGGVTISTSLAAEIRCRRVVVAMSPPLAGRIRYDPPVPAVRDQLTQRMPMGSILKMLAVYDRPFWREDGLSGEVVGLDGPLPSVFDVSHPGGPGYLCCLVPGRAAQRLGTLDPSHRRDLVLGELTRLFGPRARTPLDWTEKMWADDPWSRGAYAAYLPPGVLTSVGPALWEPVGRVHWAGAETADAWTGYIEGAVRSGERAAAEVWAALDAAPRPAGVGAPG